MNAAGQLTRAKEVARRLERGESMADLAEAYGVSRMTIWRWNSKGVQHLIPAPDDRDTWREELTAAYTQRIIAAQESGDDLAFVRLTEGLRKMIGLDHSAKLEEAALRIEAAKLDLLADALARALDDAGVGEETRALIAAQLDTRLAELEAAK